MKYFTAFTLCFLSFCTSYAQAGIAEKYQVAYNQLQKLVEQPYTGAFKKAVFITENVFNNNSMDEAVFENNILVLSTLVNGFMRNNRLGDYKFADSANVMKNYALFKLLKDTINVQATNGRLFQTRAYTYDFNDFLGMNDWQNMFVSKLLDTHKGNCHSLPYLYKILADEIGATCWLSLAPNHIYIKNRCKKFGWYNTELTSGTFPIDAWVMASGYIPLEAIQNSIYMDTLDNQRSIALCILDLAKGYEKQTKNYYDGFIVKCCDLLLQYHSNNVMAILLKAETMKKLYLKEQADKYPKMTYTPIQMSKLYGQLFDLGYREMPEKMYLSWLQSVQKEKAKYTDKRLGTTIKKK